MDLESKIYIAGHQGLVGSAITRCLRQNGYNNLLLRTHQELELTDSNAVSEFFEKEKPEIIILAAAKVGGIYANITYPAEFIYQNLQIQNNVIHEAWRSNVKRLLFLGSSCIYPRECPQPMKEEYLYTGPLEPTNRPYAMAKIAGIEMCWSYNRQYSTEYLAVMPTNVYGPGDNYDLETSHVLPALIRKMHEAKKRNEATVLLWGTGTPRREFLYCDDLADACLFLLKQSDNVISKLINDNETAPLINIGCGIDQTISELANLIKEIVGYHGRIDWNRDKPDGMSRKLLDISKIKKIGWTASTALADGIDKNYQYYQVSQSFQK